ncbi:FAD-binding oxidoreductase [Gilvimarinus xylanilyticus]|uniref:FAD-binding oxidoreductase n=1 Tax=Gilvimarinus xylanilyticus TaxID=2944139 RepID=A0A9X2I030_9GAMM|nr:FAD-binding oxidoreductase [Gilvimarinus xylanilyticus]MCP8899686.1 FAD-binding oxidoreductase [Gilvimarinus xylanilyticus]
MRKSVAIIALGLSVPLIQAQSIAPFSSDGCSRFPNGTLEQQDLWLECCEKHDFAYWRGGTYTQRREADQALEACVAKLDEPVIASVMYMGVRLGGTPFVPTDFRWGYGWPEYRGYRALSTAEQQSVEKAIEALKPAQRERVLPVSVIKPVPEDDS